MPNDKGQYHGIQLNLSPCCGEPMEERVATITKNKILVCKKCNKMPDRPGDRKAPRTAQEANELIGYEGASIPPASEDFLRE